jgi:hypothetical protein
LGVAAHFSRTVLIDDQVDDHIAVGLGEAGEQHDRICEADGSRVIEEGIRRPGSGTDQARYGQN